ncbi:hypothetical protein [Geobacter sp. DSM 9736]|uniref:hypothetical protein n=1 Tax=Geobacter sp. DSM 9736 TaxID=1277350 RepID=UPI000B50CAEB|nr:hypothetical protein [Geobacter sp. DSM 9736]SNB44777.1 hypothetical protein SAMN06269301_0164 [Geobacter sp. DSM 9736]
MDKVRVLKNLRGRTAEELTTDELKLYLLLLVACGTTGEGEIGSVTIRAAMGESFCIIRLRHACRGLAARGLIGVNGDLPERLDEDFRLSYRVVAAGEEQDGK